MYHILKNSSTEEIYSVRLCKWPSWAQNAGLGRETSTSSSLSSSSRKALKPFILQMPHACSQDVLLRSPWEGEGLLGQLVGMGRCELDLRKATVQSRTDKNANSCLTLWELAFLCYLSYQFFSVVSPNSVSAGNSDAKGAYLGWLKSIPGHSVASGSSPALRAWVLAAPVRCELQVTQLCRCVSHTSRCDLLRGPTPRCWSNPTSCSQSAIGWTQRTGQSWHGSPHHSVNSLEICKASWNMLCFHSGHLLWAHKIACAGDQQVSWGVGFLSLPLQRWEQSLRRVKKQRFLLDHIQMFIAGKEIQATCWWLFQLSHLTRPCSSVVWDVWTGSSGHNLSQLTVWGLFRRRDTGTSISWQKGTARALSYHCGYCCLTHTWLWRLYLCCRFRMPDVGQLRTRRGGWLKDLQLALHGWEGAGSWLVETQVKEEEWKNTEFRWGTQVQEMGGVGEVDRDMGLGPDKTK